MKLEQISLPVNNKLLADYWSGNEKLKPFYEYEYNDESFLNRANYLRDRQYNTSELSKIIRSFMEPFGISDKVNENLKHLDNGAFAIVGGQQAGILTGPLYSVHKAISVVKLAKEQSEKLGLKVIPLFWIAGEDHDLEEINHTFTIVNGEIKKQVYSQRSRKKTMASTTIIDKDEMKKLVDTIFKEFGETDNSKTLYQSVLRQIDQSETFTDFFARLMNSLFKEEGLLMIDAAYEPFRKYEASFFKKLIHYNEEIASAVVAKEQKFCAEKYGNPICATKENANLFYIRDGERFLLERKNHQYFNLNANIKFTKEELLQIALNYPEQLSNNVVTRPLMQEMTIPVLAFVGGPGELAYWATLKDAFHILDLQMPILAPRLNITLITHQLNQLLSDYQLTFEEIINGKVNTLKSEFIESIQDEIAKEQISEINELINEQYKKLNEHLNHQNLQLDKIIEKNKQYHQNQLEYLSRKIEQFTLIKHEVTIRRLNTISSEIYPQETFQERVYNPYKYMNVYGPSLISDLIKLPLTISNTHYIVHL